MKEQFCSVCERHRAAHNGVCGSCRRSTNRFAGQTVERDYLPAEMQSQIDAELASRVELVRNDIRARRQMLHAEEMQPWQTD